MDPNVSLSELLASLAKLQRPAPPAPPPPPGPEALAPLPRLLEGLRCYAGFRATPHLERKLEKVFQGTRPDQLGAWVDTLLADPARRELLALVEDLTNHETYFFRDSPQLDVLAQHLLPELVQRKARSTDKSLRLWSAACSTGEEAWTLAMMALQALLDAGIAREVRGGEVWLPPDWRLEVVGTDISRQAIRIAQGGAYRTEAMASFRDFPPAFRRFFVDAPATGGNGAGYRQVHPSLRAHVRFELFNLVGTTPPCCVQDLVVCRNVLIYLDTAVHGNVQRMLAQALRRGGHLMLGVVDRLQARDLFTDRVFSQCVIHERK